MLIFEQGTKNRRAFMQAPRGEFSTDDFPAHLLRETTPTLPEVSELQAVRHYTKLSQKNFSIDTQFYPLGSCTMKYNPRGVHRLATYPGYLGRHPLAPDQHSQGYLQSIYELQEILKSVTGMQGISLAPMAGAQGEFAGVQMIQAYHEARGDTARSEIIVPEAAHGTNPASAVMCGYTVKSLPIADDGDVDFDALKSIVGPQTAGIMLTNPSTLGVFERRIKDVADLIHDAGGLLYYDGANLNAILGKTRPGDMGFDVMHMNLHKTFATPHGAGGPGSGPVAVAECLEPYLPVPIVVKEGEYYRLVAESERPDSIGHLSAFAGNANIMLRAYIYARMLGREGLIRAGEFATLNANYLMKRLQDAGFDLAYPERRATHEFIITMARQAKQMDITAMDFAKRLLDYDMHAPTTYFPLLIAECLLIEPTETESKEVLDKFVEVMIKIQQEAESDPDMVRNAPYTRPVRRLDDVKAARELDLVWKEPSA